MNQPKASKVLVLGIDGMDPRLTRRFVDEGVMPNTKKFIERGAQRHDLVMLGVHPTVTPSMWTTLATGAYSMTHGITDFYRQNKENLDMMDYNLDSRLCQAEQIWNVLAEAGKKTLVWHWPGSSWPPTAESPNLHVVDGSSPGGVNMSNCQLESEYLVAADVKYQSVTFQEKAGDEVIPCVITDLDVAEAGSSGKKKTGIENTGAKGIRCIILKYGEGAGSLDYKMDIAMSPVKEAANWAEAPSDAKEFTLLLSGGLVSRSCQILKNAEGVYDRVAVFKSKKERQPMYVLLNDVFTEYIPDICIKDDKTYQVIRHMRIINMEPDGSSVKIWVSAAMDTQNDALWYPKTLFQDVSAQIASPPPSSMLFAAQSRELFWGCMLEAWNVCARWQADAIHLLIKKYDYDAVFSHFHNLDLQKHTFYKYLVHGAKVMQAAEFEELIRDLYIQADEYLGRFLHFLDEGWTVFIVSDHALVATGNQVPLLGDMNGVNVGVMRELGFTQVKKDANGSDLKEIDWENTKAVATRGVHINLNVKGRDKHGIVKPEDQYEVEEEIMTALYGYRHPETGHRIVALALRNKDAVLLGLGGPESGDIVYFTAEGYNYDHTDSLSTTYGACGTSVSPIFIAAGPGLKSGFTTTRVIREVDVAPTVAALLGERMPKECEGAPVYQILAEEYRV
ncbi:MAG: alkaline phosphatase family protein [Gracilibacteraceae bacterium]|jgi:predicted AlkP superfamily phosphohydrolase/phosphomutase|nr:alkaline phosphatase family protein [Gracilibacteraceae bacterium]